MYFKLILVPARLCALYVPTEAIRHSCAISDWRICNALGQMTVKRFKWLPHSRAGLRAGNLKLARQEIAPVGIYILISINPPKSWVGRCLQSMWGFWRPVTNTSLNTAFNATVNGGACYVLTYGKQKVLLEPIFIKLFWIAWPMHCIAGGTCISVIQRLHVCWMIFVNATQVMIILFFCSNHANFAIGLQNHALLAFSILLRNGSFKLHCFAAYAFLIFCVQIWHTFLGRLFAMDPQLANLDQYLSDGLLHSNHTANHNWAHKYDSFPQ